MSSRISDTDKGFAAMVARLKASGPSVRVGILEPDKQHSNGRTVGEVAQDAEFGAAARGIPQRSFLRAGVDELEPQIRAELKAAAVHFADGKASKEACLQQVGARVASMLANRLRKGIAPANDPKTIAKKHSDTPLVDTGLLADSITYAIER